VYDSLFDTRMASDGAVVGLENFVRLFADNVFWQSLLNNLLYILLTVVPGVTLALLLAALTEKPPRQPLAAHRLLLPDDYPDGQRRRAVAVIFMPGLGLLDHYLAKLFGPMNNNWLGRSNSAAGAGADWRVEVRLLHAVFPRRVAEHPGLHARSGDGRRHPQPGVL
jgi:sn-glycerol 3-phosphate transport system permease protein